MLRNIFLKSLRDRIWSLLAWSAGIAALVIFIASFYPVVARNLIVVTFLEDLPPGLMAFLGGVLDFASPAGFINVEVFTITLPLVLLIFAISFGAAVIAGEEQRGALDLLLANPVSRTRVLLESFGALVAALALLCLVLWDGLAIGIKLFNIDLPLGNITAGVFSLFLLTVAMGALTLALGAATGNPRLAVGVTTVVTIASYLLNSAAHTVKNMEPFRNLSVFYYYSGAEPLRNGLNWGHAGVLVGLTALFILVGLVSFNRRDIRV